jgi:hypothetical protein
MKAHRELLEADAGAMEVNLLLLRLIVEHKRIF